MGLAAASAAAWLGGKIYGDYFTRWYTFQFLSFGIATMFFLAVSPKYAAWRARQPEFGMVPAPSVGTTARVTPMGNVQMGDEGGTPHKYVDVTGATTRRR